MQRPTPRGVTLADALRTYGKNPNDIPAAAYRPADAAAYIEVHIEQGPVLEAKGQPLGIVTGIVGQVRLRVTVTGEAGHAGTVPMNLRHDAYAGAAEMALALETIARAHPEDGMVGTVGRIGERPKMTVNSTRPGMMLTAPGVASMRPTVPTMPSSGCSRAIFSSANAISAAPA